jgi:hypothetical protein
MPNRSSTASRLQPYQKTNYKRERVKGDFELMSPKEFERFCLNRIKRLKSGKHMGGQ